VSVAEQRPHLGEPLALDLLNTRWMSPEGPRDLLVDSTGLRSWLSANELDKRCVADEKTRLATISAREAIRQTAANESTVELAVVLEHGRIRRTITESGPVDVAEVAHPEWLPGWLAADNLLHLLGDAPDRIKQCAHPHCVLWFYDTSKNGARRWHSMATCGNRAKAARHYAMKKS
jgi:predicted RNA-binding Zn ribbon-like protein